MQACAAERGSVSIRGSREVPDSSSPYLPKRMLLRRMHPRKSKENGLRGPPMGRAKAAAFHL